MQRPLAITIVASLIIAIGALSFLSVIFVSVHRPLLTVGAYAGHTGIPLTTLHAVGFLAATVEILSGILMLRGWDIGRAIYAVIGAIMLALAFVTAPFKLIPIVELIVFAIFLAILFHPLSTRWFNRSDSARFFSAPWPKLDT